MDADGSRAGRAGYKPLKQRMCRIATGLLILLALPGCQTDKRVETAVIDNLSNRGLTIAVAPALNQSGSADFDPSRFADLMASELDNATGISVIPVSRVLAALAAEGVSIVIISSEMPEIIGMCHRVYVMREGRIAGVLTGKSINENTIMRAAAGLREAA